MVVAWGVWERYVGFASLSYISVRPLSVEDFEMFNDLYAFSVYCFGCSECSRLTNCSLKYAIRHTGTFLAFNYILT